MTEWSQVPSLARPLPEPEPQPVLAPLTAAAMNIFAAGASFGLVVAVFQWGWGSSLLDAGTGPVESFLPTPQYVTISIPGGPARLRDLQTNQIIDGQPQTDRLGPATRSTTPQSPPRFVFTAQLRPHSYEAFAVER